MSESEWRSADQSEAVDIHNRRISRSAVSESEWRSADQSEAVDIHNRRISGITVSESEWRSADKPQKPEGASACSDEGVAVQGTAPTDPARRRMTLQSRPLSPEQDAGHVSMERRRMTVHTSPVGWEQDPGPKRMSQSAVSESELRSVDEPELTHAADAQSGEGVAVDSMATTDPARRRMTLQSRPLSPEQDAGHVSMERRRMTVHTSPVGWEQEPGPKRMSQSAVSESELRSVDEPELTHAADAQSGEGVAVDTTVTTDPARRRMTLQSRPLSPEQDAGHVSMERRRMTVHTSPVGWEQEPGPKRMSQSAVSESELRSVDEPELTHAADAQSGEGVAVDTTVTTDPARRRMTVHTSPVGWEQDPGPKRMSQSAVSESELRSVDEPELTHAADAQSGEGFVVDSMATTDPAGRRMTLQSRPLSPEQDAGHVSMERRRMTVHTSPVGWEQEPGPKRMSQSAVSESELRSVDEPELTHAADAQSGEGVAVDTTATTNPARRRMTLQSRPLSPEQDAGRVSMERRRMTVPTSPVGWEQDPGPKRMSQSAVSESELRSVDEPELTHAADAQSGEGVAVDSMAMPDPARRRMTLQSRPLSPEQDAGHVSMERRRMTVHTSPVGWEQDPGPKRMSQSAVSESELRSVDEPELTHAADAQSGEGFVVDSMATTDPAGRRMTLQSRPLSPEQDAGHVSMERRRMTVHTSPVGWEQDPGPKRMSQSAVSESELRSVDEPDLTHAADAQSGEGVAVDTTVTTDPARRRMTLQSRPLSPEQDAGHVSMERRRMTVHTSPVGWEQDPGPKRMSQSAVSESELRSVDEPELTHAADAQSGEGVAVDSMATTDPARRRMTLQSRPLSPEQDAGHVSMERRRMTVHTSPVGWEQDPGPKRMSQSAVSESELRSVDEPELTHAADAQSGEGFVVDSMAMPDPAGRRMTLQSRPLSPEQDAGHVSMERRRMTVHTSPVGWEQDPGPKRMSQSAVSESELRSVDEPDLTHAADAQSGEGVAVDTTVTTDPARRRMTLQSRPLSPEQDAGHVSMERRRMTVHTSPVGWEQEPGPKRMSQSAVSESELRSVDEPELTHAADAQSGEGVAVDTTVTTDPARRRMTVHTSPVGWEQDPGPKRMSQSAVSESELRSVDEPELTHAADAQSGEGFVVDSMATTDPAGRRMTLQSRPLSPEQDAGHVSMERRRMTVHTSPVGWEQEPGPKRMSQSAVSESELRSVDEPELTHAADAQSGEGVAVDTTATTNPARRRMTLQSRPLSPEQDAGRVSMERRRMTVPTSPVGWEQDPGPKRMSQSAVSESELRSVDEPELTHAADAQSGEGVAVDSMAMPDPARRRMTLQSRPLSPEQDAGHVSMERRRMTVHTSPVGWEQDPGPKRMSQSAVSESELRSVDEPELTHAADAQSGEGFVVDSMATTDPAGRRMTLQSRPLSPEQDAGHVSMERRRMTVHTSPVGWEQDPGPKRMSQSAVSESELRSVDEPDLTHAADAQSGEGVAVDTTVTTDPARRRMTLQSRPLSPEQDAGHVSMERRRMTVHTSPVGWEQDPGPKRMSQSAVSESELRSVDEPELTHAADAQSGEGVAVDSMAMPDPAGRRMTLQSRPLSPEQDTGHVSMERRRMTVHTSPVGWEQDPGPKRMSQSAVSESELRSVDEPELTHAADAQSGEGFVVDSMATTDPAGRRMTLQSRPLSPEQDAGHVSMERRRMTVHTSPVGWEQDPGPKRMSQSAVSESELRSVDEPELTHAADAQSGEGVAVDTTATTNPARRRMTLQSRPLSPEQDAGRVSMERRRMTVHTSPVGWEQDPGPKRMSQSAVSESELRSVDEPELTHAADAQSGEGVAVDSMAMPDPARRRMTLQSRPLSPEQDAGHVSMERRRMTVHTSPVGWEQDPGPKRMSQSAVSESELRSVDEPELTHAADAQSGEGFVVDTMATTDPAGRRMTLQSRPLSPEQDAGHVSMERRRMTVPTSPVGWEQDPGPKRMSQSAVSESELRSVDEPELTHAADAQSGEWFVGPTWEQDPGP